MLGVNSILFLNQLNESSWGSWSCPRTLLHIDRGEDRTTNMRDDHFIPEPHKWRDCSAALATLLFLSFQPKTMWTRGSRTVCGERPDWERIKFSPWCFHFCQKGEPNIKLSSKPLQCFLFISVTGVKPVNNVYSDTVINQSSILLLPHFWKHVFYCFCTIRLLNYFH